MRPRAARRRRRTCVRRTRRAPRAGARARQRTPDRAVASARWSLMDAVPRQRPIEPGARERPIACAPCAAETPSVCAVSSIDNPPKNRSSTTRALRGSSAPALERVIDGDQIRVALVRRQVDVIERHANGAGPAATIGAASPRDVDEHAAHHLRRHAEEVAAVLPARLIPPEQSKTHLVDERRRLERDVRSLAGEIAQGHPVQLVVDERDQPLERVLVAIAPHLEQAGDIAVRRPTVQAPS